MVGIDLRVVVPGFGSSWRIDRLGEVISDRDREPDGPIWGGEEPVFQTEDEMRTVLGTIMGHYNEIVAGLDTDPDDFDPIFLGGLEGEIIASDWAGGYLNAVAMRCVQRHGSRCLDI